MVLVLCPQDIIKYPHPQDVIIVPHIFTLRDTIHKCHKINSAFLLAIVATPMDSAYSMHNAYRHVLSAHAHN